MTTDPNYSPFKHFGQEGGRSREEWRETYFPPPVPPTGAISEVIDGASTMNYVDGLIDNASAELRALLGAFTTTQKRLNWCEAELPVRQNRIEELEATLNTPEVRSFMDGVNNEAAHQRARWGVEHDAGKSAADWFWLLGYVAGKALQADKVGDTEKLLHHIVTTAAVCANWHLNVSGADTSMRPGIEPPYDEMSDGGRFG